MKLFHLILLSLWGLASINGYSQSAGVNAYKRVHIRSTRPMIIPSVKSQAKMCYKSSDCPDMPPQYCCEVIKGIFNVCCWDPMRAIEYNDY